jgi:hypothetical protein
MIGHLLDECCLQCINQVHTASLARLSSQVKTSD